MDDLSHVRAVVTGATSGLGAAMARALMESGATVALASRQSPRLHEVAGHHRAQGLRALAVPMDVRDPGSVQAGADQAIELMGGVDLVVNNAGIGMRTVNPRFFDAPMPFYEIGPEAFNDVIATNLTGYFLVARAFAPFFVSRGEGRFVNISMNHETMRRRGFVPYGPARAGAESLSYVMVEDLRPHGVTVNLLLPGGATATGMIPDDLPEDRRSGLLSPEVMNAPLRFLASAEARGLTGERIVAKDFDRWLDDWRGREAGPQLDR